MTTYFGYSFVRAAAINAVKLAREILEAGYDGTVGDTVAAREEVQFSSHVPLDSGDQATIQAVVDAHDPVDHVGIQQDAVRDAVRDHIRALRALPPQDAAYALMGRMMAFNDGAGGTAINAIIDRASAIAYVTGKTEWSNLTAASRAWHTDVLDMHAGIYQLLLYLLDW